MRRYRLRSGRPGDSSRPAATWVDGDDVEMLPVKGQLTVLLPQPEVDYIAIKDELYMFPRSDGILLGGTHERGVETMEPDAEAKARILEGHRQLFTAPAS